MTDQEKLALLEETFEMDEGSLKPEMKLDKVDSFNSIAKLSLIVLMDDEFGKIIKSDDIKALVTVRDLLNIMTKA